MASLARVLGALCLVFAALVAAFGVWVFLEGTTASSPYDEFNDASRGFALGYLLGSLVTAIVLATIGATAIVAANAATRLAENRYQQAPRPQPAYAAPVPTYNAAAYPPAQQWPPAATPPAGPS